VRGLSGNWLSYRDAATRIERLQSGIRKFQIGSRRRKQISLNVQKSKAPQED